jgi:uncharacterized integral membrane protein
VKIGAKKLYMPSSDHDRLVYHILYSKFLGYTITALLPILLLIFIAGYFDYVEGNNYKGGSIWPFLAIFFSIGVLALFFIGFTTRHLEINRKRAQIITSYKFPVWSFDERGWHIRFMRETFDLTQFNALRVVSLIEPSDARYRIEMVNSDIAERNKIEPVVLLFSNDKDEVKKFCMEVSEFLEIKTSFPEDFAN